MLFIRRPRLIGQVEVFCSRKNGCGSPILDCRSILFEYIGQLYPPCSVRLKERLIAHWPLKDSRMPALTDHRHPGYQNNSPCPWNA